ncbi:folate-binding protein YgfZ [Mesorhizobium sp. YM1C-6-2]|uniref:CAF17-like 4Fe-4S cluster assembly/insertion protein YgfZ n=1 Tax=Mesorhizobium sp. YM1C-6-2 TaxID=1827501 RepID=UPI000EF20A27|nr:folate-binding protein YgfZ [Mesorhizobium sp. YM1C-6-2]RLP25401.1 folate-binding protein [Mesorhizobium sp. YM1C-6-2]
MPTASLDDRAIVSVSGPEAEHFLQNIVTADLDTLKQGEAKPSALLAPQGKILFDFLVSRNGAEAFRLECRADIVGDFVRRLTLYKLRAKAEISKQGESLVAVSWGSDSAPSESDSSWLRDTRFPATAPAWRSYGIEAADGDIAEWHAFRIANGIAESGADYALGDAFPHDVLLDQTDGVGFRKGCYVGQEVVSRMQHRGTARRRVLIASGDALPAPGTEVVANGRPIGTLGSTAGGKGLAILRIDRVKDALDAGAAIEAGGVPLSVVIPSWAKFTYPEQASSEDA